MKQLIIVAGSTISTTLEKDQASSEFSYALVQFFGRPRIYRTQVSVYFPRSPFGCTDLGVRHCLT